MARLAWLVFALTLVCAGGAWAQKESRIALVVGNGAYQNADALKNPVNDARAMAGVLRDAGFEVILSENATRRALTASLREFSAKLTPGGVGLFYYAGHGMQVRGANYLLPVDAALSSEDELRYETIDVNDVLNRFDEARTRLSLVILDACRDNPFARRFRSTSRGLAQTDAPRGTVIAYATAPGDTAADGDGDNGLYTTELLKAIVLPGLKLEEVFKRTIDGVARASRNKQTPWVASSFRGEFYFHAAAAAPAPPPAAQPPVVQPPVAQQPAFAVEQLELAAWNAIASSTNPEMFELFLKRFPSGVYADFARAKLAELKAAEARRVAQEEARRLAAAEETKRKADAEAKRAADEEAKRAAAAEETKRRAAAEEEKKTVEATEAALKLADIDRRRIQAALTAKGFDTQGADGAFGPRTRLMITNWQRSTREPATGFLTATQAALLSRDGESALARIEEERRKADEEKRKAEAERQKAAPAPPPAPPQQAAATPAPVAPPPPAPAAPKGMGPSGQWRLTFCFTQYQDSPLHCTSARVQVTAGWVQATLRFNDARGGPPVEISGTMQPDGTLTMVGKSGQASSTWGASVATTYTMTMTGRWSGTTGTANGATPRGRPVTLQFVGN